MKVKAHEMMKTYREQYAGVGMTQTMLAKRTGKTPARISALENGNIRLTADELLQIITDGFKTTPQIFFTTVLSENENNNKGVNEG